MSDHAEDRKSTRLNSSHTVIYTLSLHDALPIFDVIAKPPIHPPPGSRADPSRGNRAATVFSDERSRRRSEEHTSELQSHSDLHSFPTRRSSDLRRNRQATDSPSSGVTRRS